MGPSANVNIATRWAHSGLSASLFGDGCGPTRERRHCYLVGPIRIIDIILADSCGPIRECQHCYSVGPLWIIGIIIQQRLWAHPQIPTLLLGGPTQNYRHYFLPTAVGPYVNVNIATRWAHSLLSTSLFGDGCGPIREYQHCCFGGPIQGYGHYISAVAVGPFTNIDINSSAGPFEIIDIFILW